MPKISDLTQKATPVGADRIPIYDSAALDTKSATVSALFASGSPTTTRGDVVKRGAAVDERLAIGTIGQMLQVTDIGAGVLEPRWATPYVIYADARGIVADGNADAASDTGTDWTTQLQALLDEAGARTQGWASGRMGARGAVVELGTGVYRTGSLSIPGGVTLRGQGRFSTILKLKNAVNAHFITSAASIDQVALNAHYITIERLALHCNGDNQTGSNRHGIHLSVNPSFGGKATQDWNQDAHHTLRDLTIYRPRGNGVNNTGMDETRMWHVYVSDAVGFGIVTSFDAFVISCSVYNSGLSGFYISSHSARLDNCKAFSSGTITAASGHGFETVAATYGANLVNCEAQDNRAAGLYINGSTAGIYQGFVADSNSVRGIGSNAGVEVQGSASENLIDAVCHDTGRSSAGGGGQSNALDIGASAFQNVIRIGAHNINNSSGTAITPGPALKTGANAANNVVEIQSQAGFKNLGNTGAATITVNPYAGSNVMMTLTGNITMAAPSNAHVGCPLKITFIQDGTGGRKITWPSSGTQFVHSWIQNLQPSVRQTIEFVYDGTNWVQISPTPSLIFAQRSTQAGDTKATFTAATTFATQATIPASQLKLGQKIRLTFRGVFSSDVAGPTMKADLLGGAAGTTVLAVPTSASTLSNSQTNSNWEMILELVVQSLSGVSGAAGVTATCQVLGNVLYWGGSAAPSQRSVSNSTGPGNTVALVTDADNVIGVQVTCGTSAAANSITLRELIAEQAA